MIKSRYLRSNSQSRIHLEQADVGGDPGGVVLLVHDDSANVPLLEKGNPWSRC